MKKEIHPTYYLESQIVCACGNKMTIGSTKEKMETEICSQCHPFYTGTTQSFKGGRVEKFQSRMMKRQELQDKINQKEKPAKKSSSQKPTQKLQDIATSSHAKIVETKSSTQPAKKASTKKTKAEKE